MKTIGVSMIVRDEAECIEACLDSVKGADEIVIVDTGSKDNTVELCKKYTDKVYTDYKWNDDFAEARNKSLEKMTTDWVLIIDADEVLIDDVGKIKTMINGGFMSKYLGVEFIVHTNSDEIRSIRIVKNDPRIRWFQEAHNMIGMIPDDFKSSGDEETDLLTYGNTLRGYNGVNIYKSHLTIKSGYSKTHLENPDRSLRILTKMVKRNPEYGRALYYLAREYINRLMRTEPGSKEYKKNREKAIELLERCDKVYWRKMWTTIYPDALMLLGELYWDELVETGNRDRWFDGIEVLNKACKINPAFGEALYKLGTGFEETPFGPMPTRASYWKALSERASNAGVSFKRNYKEKAGV